MDPNTKTIMIFALFFLCLSFPSISLANDAEAGMLSFVKSSFFSCIIT